MLKLYLAVAAGGAAGSLARYLFVMNAARLFGSAFPWGTLGVNIIGSLLMGMVAGAFSARVVLSPEAHAFFAIGVLGGFTTFSAFSLDTWILLENGQTLRAALYIVGSVGLSIAGLLIGLSFMRRLLT